MTEHITWTFKLGLAVIFIATPMLASACEASFGDWKLARGDIASAKRTEKTGEKLPDLLTGAFGIEITFSDSAGKNFRKATDKHLNKKMPIIIGSYKIAPMIHGTISKGQTIMSVPSESEIEANEILKNLRNCI
jgi:hypothetical protein